MNDRTRKRPNLYKSPKNYEHLKLLIIHNVLRNRLKIEFLNLHAYVQSDTDDDINITSKVIISNHEAIKRLTVTGCPFHFSYHRGISRVKREIVILKYDLHTTFPHGINSLSRNINKNIYNIFQLPFPLFRQNSICLNAKVIFTLRNKNKLLYLQWQFPYSIVTWQRLQGNLNSGDIVWNLNY